MSSRGRLVHMQRHRGQKCVDRVAYASGPFVGGSTTAVEYLSKVFNTLLTLIVPRLWFTILFYEVDKILHSPK